MQGSAQQGSQTSGAAITGSDRQMDLTEISGTRGTNPTDVKDKIKLATETQNQKIRASKDAGDQKADHLKDDAVEKEDHLKDNAVEKEEHHQDALADDAESLTPLKMKLGPRGS